VPKSLQKEDTFIDTIKMVINPKINTLFERKISQITQLHYDVSRFGQ